MKVMLSLLLICFYCVGLSAQVWQWSTLFKNERVGAEEARAFLWVPDNCKKVKGVVFAQNNMEELSILEHPEFRKQMGKLGFAEIWVTPAFDHLFRFNEGAGETFNNIMNNLAEASGYTELKFAPVVPIGHSAAASWPYYFAVWKPERTLCAISVSGQWPYFRDPKFAPDIWEDRTLDAIPCLETMGEYEAANTWSNEGLKERAEHPLLAISMLACPVEGHFAASEKKIDYIALYIKKAVQYRLTNQMDGNYPVLNTIDPTSNGWMADKWRLNEAPKAVAAPVNKYKGDPKEAFWFFDEEMAKATDAYQAAYRNKKAQLLGYIQDDKMVQQRNSHLQVRLPFLPDSNGTTFKLKAGFLDTVAGESPRLKDWTGLIVGSHIGHSTANVAISINRIIGPFKKISDSIFEVSFDKTIKSNAKTYTFTFAATHSGDESYKPAVQQAEMVIPATNSQGIEQAISFEPIGNPKSGAKMMELKASSSASLPVSFYILEGPAEVVGNKLMFTTIPPQSKYPVRVTIVAWQYGTSIEPKVKTAPIVSQTFFIDK
ncbi:hypothetical protein [Parasediminibacterium sp. JCM 36343]|uniref:hypothetical protein n=1 Tax=Parasediminibacterium sp. JCM 36343 TaxID=3374279 RepID=UPI003978AE9C